MPGIPLKRLTSTNRSNSSSWIKNAAKSLGMVGVDVLKELNPTISEITTTSMKTSQEVYKQIRSGNISGTKVSNVIKGNRYVKLGQTAIKNALEDLKTGNFDNKERFGNSLFGDDDSSGMNFGDFGDDDSGSSINVIETGLSDDSVAKLGEISQRNTEAIVKSAQATIDANIGMATASMMQIQEIGTKLGGKLDTANNHLAALVEFNNANMLKFIESSTAYYERVGAKLTEEKSGDAKLTADDVFLNKERGGIEFQKYKTLVQQQMKDYFENSQAGMITDMINNFGDTLVSNPLQIISKHMIESAIPEMVKNTMEEVDQAMSGGIVTMLQRMGNNWSNDTSDGISGLVKRFVGNTFGLKTKNKEGFDLRGKVTAEPATFDGYTHHAINEIIPKYLRESTAYLKTIAEHITGDSAGALKQAEVFDYKTGTYKTANQVKKEVYAEIRDNTALAVRESAFGKAMARVGMAGDVDSQDYNNALNDFLYRLTMNGTPDFSNENWMETIDEILGQTSGTDKTKQYLRTAVESSIKDHNSGATMAPGLLAGQAARNRTLKTMEDDATGYNIYATSPDGDDLESTMATVLYSTEGGDTPENRIKKHGSIADVLDNINYLLERGINVRTTGKKPYAKDYGLRPNKRGIPKIGAQNTQRPSILRGAQAAANTLNNLVNGEEEQTEQTQNTNNATSELSEEEIRNAVNEVMQENPADETVGGFAGRFQKLGKGLVGGIYDILQGNLKGGFKQISESAGAAVDPNGKLAEKAKNTLFGQAKVDDNGDLVRDEHGNVVRDSKDALLGSANEKFNNAKAKIKGTINKISNMKVDDVKEGVMEFLFGRKVEDLPPQMLYKIYGKRVEAGQRLGSKNGVIRAVTDTFRTGMYGFYESFFGDEINPNDPPSKIHKQMKEGIQKKFKATMDSIKSNMPEPILDTMKTVKAGAGRGAASGAIGFMLGGPIGAIAGASLGIFTKSNMYQDFMFGQMDKNTNERTGGFKKQVYDAWEDFKTRHKIGSVDPKTGKRKALSKTNKMALTGAGVGFLASAFLPFGPVGGAIAGLTLGLAAGESKIHDFLFGKKTKNSKTGEEKYEKGILGRLGSLVEVKMLNPIKNAMKYAMEDATDFVKDNVLRTIGIGLNPIMTSVGIIFEDIRNAFKSKLAIIGDTMSNIMNSVTDTVDKLVINPMSKFFKKHILNSRLGKAVTGFVGGVLDKVNPVKAAQRFNEKKSLQRRITELQTIADNGSPEEAEKARKKLALLQNDNKNDRAAMAAQEEARHMYYDTNYRELRNQQMEDRGARKERRRNERGEDTTHQSNQDFIVTMTKGRLTEDTQENREIAMAEFEKGLKRTVFGKKFRGYKKGFQFQDYDPVAGEAKAVDTAAAETASNTADMKEQLDTIIQHLGEVKEERKKKIQEIEEKKRKRKEEGDPDFKKIDDEDYNDMVQLNAQIERLEGKKEKVEKQYKKTKRREARHNFTEKVGNKVEEKVDQAADFVNEHVAQPVGKVAGKIADTTGNLLWRWGHFLDPEAESWEEHKARVQTEEYKREKELKKVKGNEDREALLRGKFREQDEQRRLAEEARRQVAEAEAEETDNVGGNGDLRGYERGTRNATPGAHIVGERGPEILHIPKGSHVDPNDKIINVRIADVDKKGWKKFVKFTDNKDGQLKMAIGSSTDILPVYNMGTLGSKTANISRILGQVSSDGNIKVDAIDDDIMDDRNDGAVAETKDANEEKESFLDKLSNMKDTALNFFSGVADFIPAAINFAKTVGPIALKLAPLAGIAVGGWELWKNRSSSNEKTFASDEEGNMIVDEETGQPIQYDGTAEDEATSPLGQLGNMMAPKRSYINKETGKVETRNEMTDRSAMATNVVGQGLFHLVTNKQTRNLFGTVVIEGFQAVGKKLAEFAAKHGAEKISEKILQTCVKYAPKITETVMTKFAPQIATFMSKISAATATAAGTFGASEVLFFTIGAIGGISNPANLFDVNMKDENLGIGIKAAMTGISAVFKGFEATTAGSVLDICSLITGTNIIKTLANKTLELLLGITGGSESLAKAKENFKNDYNQEVLDQYEAYLKNMEEQGVENTMSLEDFQETTAPTFEEYNNSQNKSIWRRGFDAVVNTAKGVKSSLDEHFGGKTTITDVFGMATGSTLSTNAARALTGDQYTNPIDTLLDAKPQDFVNNDSDATAVDSTDTTGVDDGMGGFGGVPYYSQNDPRWKNAGYGTSDHATMGEAGCGPTAMAMAASKASGKEINPLQMANFAQKNGFRDETGTNSKFVQAAGNSLGLETKSTKSPDESFIHNELSQGKPVVLLGRDGGYGNSAFTKAGHYVVATGETPDGGIMINDPRGKQFSGKYNKNEVLGESAKAWSIGGRGNETATTGSPGITSHKLLLNAIKNTTDFAVGQLTSNGLGVRPEDVVAVARNEIGYHEKASNSQLDIKEANPGEANYTKYGAWTGAQGQPWCASFVCWCIGQAANDDREIVKQLIYGPISAACDGLWNNFTKAQRVTMDPQPGDVLFYGDKSHVGLVVGVNNGEVISVEGNTNSKGSREGTIVKEKRQPANSKGIKGYGRPNYDTASNFKGILPSTSATVDGSALTTADGSGISAMQLAKGVIASGIAGLFDKAAIGVKNFWETGAFNTEDTTQYDENGNSISSFDASAATAGVVGVSGMSDIDPAQFTSDIPHAEAAFKYFISQGYSPAAAAGIIGNLMHESGGADLDPTVIQGKGKGPAAGIAQWENYNKKASRWLELSQFAQSKGKEWTDFGTQVEFIHHELSGSQKTYFGKESGMRYAGAEPTTYEEWMQTDDVEKATRQFEGAFERASAVAMEPRLSYAKGVYNKFVGTTMDAKDVTSEDAQLTSVGDLRRQEAAARQEASTGMGGFGDVDSDSFNDFTVSGGYGSEQTSVQNYTPSKPVSKQASIIAKTTGSSSFNGETFAKQMIQYLQAIAENTGVSASKLDYLKSLPTGGATSTTVNQGATMIQSGNKPTLPLEKSSKQIKAERIALG